VLGCYQHKPIIEDRRLALSALQVVGNQSSWIVVTIVNYDRPVKSWLALASCTTNSAAR